PSLAVRRHQHGARRGDLCGRYVCRCRDRTLGASTADFDLKRGLQSCQARRSGLPTTVPIAGLRQRGWLMQHFAISTLILGMLLCFSANFSLAQDATLENGYLSRAHPKSGVLVHLHGCDGLIVNGRLKSWMSYFEKLGYKVIAPNSFADKRPPVSCKPPFPDKSIIYSIRIAQTKRVLEQVRQQYPGSRIYVWGHSEGGGVANLIDEKLDGIITTGYQCGFRSTASSRIRNDVSLLALIDGKDGYLEGAVKF